MAMRQNILLLSAYQTNYNMLKYIFSIKKKTSFYYTFVIALVKTSLYVIALVKTYLYVIALVKTYLYVIALVKTYLYVIALVKTYL